MPDPADGSGSVFEGGSDPQGGAPAQAGGTATPPASTTGDNGGATATPPAQATAQPQLTPQAIAEAMKAAGVGQQAPPQEAPKQWTQEDFDKHFQVFNPNPEMVQALLAGGEGAVKAMHVLRDGLVKQAVTMAAYIVQDRLDQFSKEHSPKWEGASQYVQEKRAKELVDEFYSQNEDLKKFEPIVQATIAQMKGEGHNFKTKEEGFKACAERVRAVLKSLPGLNLEDAAAGASPQSPATPRMPTLSNGGQGGSGKGPNGAGGKVNPSHAVFG